MEQTLILNTIELKNLFYKKMIDFKPSTFIEVGPFEAEASKYISDQLKETQVYAYEANPYNYQNFKKSIEKYNIVYKNIAISNTKKVAPFFLQKRDYNIEYIKGSHSLLKRTNKKIDYEEVFVNCNTLDSLNYKPNETFGLWLDAEGHNYDVLCGSTNILKNTFIIIVEVERKQYWKNQKLDTDIINYLKSFKFNILAKDQEYPEQYNIIFTKEI